MFPRVNGKNAVNVCNLLMKGSRASYYYWMDGLGFTGYATLFENKAELFYQDLNYI